MQFHRKIQLKYLNHLHAARPGFYIVVSRAVLPVMGVPTICAHVTWSPLRGLCRQYMQ